MSMAAAPQDRGCIVVLITCPNPEVGEAIARVLVEERLAACVNLLPAMTSIYHL